MFKCYFTGECVVAYCVPAVLSHPPEQHYVDLDQTGASEGEWEDDGELSRNLETMAIADGHVSVPRCIGS